VSLTRIRTGFVAALALATGVAGSAIAQVRQPGESLSVGDGSGPLSDVSTNVGHDGRPMHDGAQTLGESSGGPVHSGPISDWDTRSMLSGPVSSMSQGPMYRPQPSLSGGSMTEASAGAVKHDVASPLGTRISDPLHELGGLREQMRARRQQAEQDALQRAAEPALPAADAAAWDAVAAEAAAIDAAAAEAAAAEAAAADAAASEAASADAASHEDGETGDPAEAPAPGDGP
jgi:hypothetical protein